MKKWIIFSLIILSVFLVIAIPVAMDWLIVGNNIPSNISNSEWVGFLGSYIGAILGGIVSLIGIIVTIKFTKQQLTISQKQFIEQNRLNNKPILDFELSNIFNIEDDETIVMNCEYTLNNEMDFQKAIVEFEVHNIGLGAAWDINYGIELEGIQQDGVFGLWKNSFLKSGNTMKQKLSLLFPARESFSLDILVFYDDILNNRYIKKVKLLNQPTAQGQNVMCILTQDKGEVCDVEFKKKHYVISSIQPADFS